MSVVLEARDITKVYGHVSALSGANFEVRAGEVTALSETPKTEVLWFDSRARGEDGQPVAEMRMMLRQMKQSSPLYHEQAASA